MKVVNQNGTWALMTDGGNPIGFYSTQEAAESAKLAADHKIMQAADALGTNGGPAFGEDLTSRQALQQVNENPMPLLDRTKTTYKRGLQEKTAAGDLLRDTEQGPVATQTIPGPSPATPQIQVEDPQAQLQKWGRAAQAADKVYSDTHDWHQLITSGYAYEKAGEHRKAYDTYIRALRHHGKDMSLETKKLVNQKAWEMAGQGGEE